MKKLTTASVAGLLAGLIVYGLLMWVFPDVDINAFGNLIGLAALLGAAGGTWWQSRSGAGAAAEPAAERSTDATDATEARS